MEAIILAPDHFNKLMEQMEELKSMLIKKQQDPAHLFVDNQEFIQLMNISKRTAQKWRDEGTISYSQIGSKIYYSMADVQELLSKTYRPAFSNH